MSRECLRDVQNRTDCPVGAGCRAVAGQNVGSDVRRCAIPSTARTSDDAYDGKMWLFVEKAAPGGAWLQVPRPRRRSPRGGRSGEPQALEVRRARLVAPQARWRRLRAPVPPVGAASRSQWQLKEHDAAVESRWRASIHRHGSGGGARRAYSTRRCVSLRSYAAARGGA